MRVRLIFIGTGRRRKFPDLWYTAILHKTHKCGEGLEFLESLGRMNVVEVSAVQLRIGYKRLHPLIHFTKDTCNQSVNSLEHSILSTNILSDQLQF